MIIARFEGFAKNRFSDGFVKSPRSPAKQQSGQEGLRIPRREAYLKVLRTDEE
jgi:hypothetical protein